MSLVEHLEKLRHFQKVAGFRSINEASKAIGLSQAGLSKSIINLETVIGAPLFVRSKEGLVLTPEGSMTLQVARKIIDEATELETQLKSMKTAPAPELLHVGMYDSIAVYFFPILSAHLRQIYKNVSLKLVIDNSSALAERMANKELDIAIGVNLKEKASLRTEFFLLFEDYFSLFVSTNSQLSEDQLPILVHASATDAEGTTLKEYFDHLRDKRNFHESYNFETLKILTAQGQGIGVLPTRVAQPLVQAKQLRPTSLPRMKAAFGRHNIGLMVQKKLLNQYERFAQDIYALGQNWAKI